MLGHYLKAAWRHFKRHKGYSFINISGLAIGLACGLVIFLYIQDELSYDGFHKNIDRIYRVAIRITMQNRILEGPESQMPLGPLLISNYPEVDGAVRFNQTRKTVVRYADKEFYQSNILYTDASVFKVFTFPLVRGNPQTVLEKPFSAVLTETTARRYFGNDDPVAKVLRFNGETDYTVTGIVQDLPPNSSLRFDVLCSLESQFAQNPQSRNDWIDIRTQTFILLKHGHDYRALEKKMDGIVAERLGPALKTVGGQARYFLHPLSRIHLHYPGYGDESFVTGNIASIYVLATIALLILGIACTNFMNLATARSAQRAKEVGMRKVVGAFRRDLVWQFLGESLTYALFASIVALLLVHLALPALEWALGIRLALKAGAVFRWLPAFVLLVLIAGISAGSYPAFFLSSFHPTHALKGGLRSGPQNARFRRVLVGLQFAVSIILIAGTSLVRQQLLYMKTKPLGFNKEQVLVMEILNDRQVFKSTDAIKNRLKQVPGVLAVSAAQGVPGRGLMDNIPLVPEGFSPNESLTMKRFCADADFLPVMGIKLVAGRNFSDKNPSDPESAVILNETAVKILGWDEPLGKTIKIPVSPVRMQPKTVIGVVRDFHTSSLREQIEPVCIENSPRKFYSYVVKAKAENVSRLVEQMRDSWKDIGTKYPYDFFFLDKALDAQYRAEERIGRLFTSFSALATAIACLGLLGLSAFMAEQRTKEVGIRKVLGASAGELVALLCREYLVIVSLASLLAWPVAAFAMHIWLRNFAYRVHISPWNFIASGLAALATALLTVSFQALKAATANPARALRHE